MASNTYSCDFDAVYQKCDELDNLATELDELAAGSDHDIDEELSAWLGDSSEVMHDNTDTLTEDAKDKANLIREYSSWVRKNASIIEEAEEELSRLKI